MTPKVTGEKKKVETKPTDEKKAKKKKSRKEKQEKEGRHCQICYKRARLFGVASCLHRICLECSIRIRILSKSNECPVCCTEVDTIYIVEVKNWSKFQFPKETVPHQDEKKHGIRFASDLAITAYESCLENRCSICAESGKRVVFDNFLALRAHLQLAHKRSHCHYCLENINALVGDRRLYDKDALMEHLNGTGSEGDGYRGHPKCMFCQERFYDEEQVYRHLKRDHFVCALCEADGAINFFHEDSKHLTMHYRTRHYVCPVSECATAGIVFRSELELMEHKSTNHPVSGGGSRGRTSLMDFPFSARNADRSRVRVPIVARLQARQAIQGSEGGQVEDLQQRVQIVPSSQVLPRSRATPSLVAQRMSEMRIVPSAEAITIPQARRSIQGVGTAPQPAYQEATEEFPSLVPPSQLRQALAVSQSARSVQWGPGVYQPAKSFSPKPSGPLEDVQQFPSLSSTGAPSATQPTLPADSVWGQKKTSELFKYGSSERPKGRGSKEVPKRRS